MKICFSKAVSNRAKAGTSFLDTLMGTAIFGTMFVSVCTGVGAGLKSTEVSRQNARAAQILIGKLECLRVLNWPDLSAPGALATTFTAPYEMDGATAKTLGMNVSSTNAFFQGKLSLKPSTTGESYSTNVLQVTAEVTWSFASRNFSRSVETLISAHGIQNRTQ